MLGSVKPVADGMPASRTPFRVLGRETRLVDKGPLAIRGEEYERLFNDGVHNPKCYMYMSSRAGKWR